MAIYSPLQNSERVRITEYKIIARFSSVAPNSGAVDSFNERIGNSSPLAPYCDDMESSKFTY